MENTNALGQTVRVTMTVKPGAVTFTNGQGRNR